MRRAVCRLSDYSAVLTIPASVLFSGPALAQRVGEVETVAGSVYGQSTGTGKDGSGWKIVAEFSRTPFVGGSVGMIRDRSYPNSADSQFFVAYKDLPQLAGKYTKWGQIFSGMEQGRGLALDRSPRTVDKIAAYDCSHKRHDQVAAGKPLSAGALLRAHRGHQLFQHLIGLRADDPLAAGHEGRHPGDPIGA
jgi:cyclophilin family peptidyl-prolyl cis-trans isomerase